MSIKRLLAGLIIGLFYILQPAIAQDSNLLERDLSKVRASQISDAQLRQFIEAAEERNLSDQEIQSTAVLRGMSRAEVSKLMSRIRSLRLQSDTGGQNQTSTQGGLAQQDSLGTNTPQQAGLGLLTAEERKVFGMEMFNNQNISFEPSLQIATPEDYQLGPGDELVVNIWGASRQNYALEVSRDGTVTVDNLGPIYVNGLSIDEASDRIINRLTEIYAGLRGYGERGANTFAEVSLGRVRSIKVTIVGEVRKPGTYTIPSLASAFNALYLSGGPTFIGSFRNVEVVRNRQVVATLDVYDYLVKGASANTIRLQDQDVIRVVPFDIRIELQGEVKRPGYYEMKTQEPMAEAIRFSGGFTDKAYTHRMEVVRKTDRAKRLEDLSGDALDSFLPKNGDIVRIDSILDRFENRVEILGAVFRTGAYALEGGMTLRDLIRKAEGLREDAFTSRALISRKGEDLMSEVISVNLRNVLTEREPDVLLQRDDVVRVFSIFDLEEEYSVQVKGEVQTPGAFQYMRGMRLEDVIAMAGGLKESASLARVEVARRVTMDELDSDADQASFQNNQMANVYRFSVDKDLSLNPETAAFELMPFDQVFVRKSPEYEVQQGVALKGEVLYPGEYVITNKSERISDLINRAGGLTNFAYEEGARLIRLNPEYYELLEEERQNILDSLQLAQVTTVPPQGTNGNQTQQGNNQKVDLQQLDPELLNALAAGKVEIAETNAIGIDLGRILANPDSKYDLILLPGDTLEVPQELQTVRMNGELLYPSSTRFDRSRGFRHYISEAGGFTKQADKGRSYVVYANGSVDRTNNFLFFKDYPKVKPGAEIIIPQKQGGLSAQAWVGIGSTLASIALTIVTVINVANRN
jgi:protein involved in polysaccharide export with SLBB domain